MCQLGKLAVGLLGVGLTAGFVLLTGCGGANSFSLHPEDPLQAEAERLGHELEAVRRRMEAVESLVVSLSEGRTSLAQGAGEFLALHEGDPRFFESYRLHYPNQTPLERAARDIANRAHFRIADPIRREPLITRLTEEFRILFPQAEPLAFDPVQDPDPHQPPHGPGRPPLPPRVPRAAVATAE